MAVLTLAQYKALTGVTSTAKDTQITALLDVIDAYIVQKLGVTPTSIGIQLVACKMVSFALVDLVGTGLKSESIEGYRYSKEEMGEGGWPKSIDAQIETFRVMSPKYTHPVTQFRDRRFLNVEQLANDISVGSVPGIPIE